MINVFKPSYNEVEVQAVRQVFESGWIGLGPRTEEFEQKFAEYVGAKHAVAMNSATAALHLSLLALGIGPGDEVLVPTMTFVSTAHAVTYCGAKPVFVDARPDTLNASCIGLIDRQSEKTKAIIPVHYGGHTCPMDWILEWAEEYGFVVIEDAAHACGSEHRGQKIGGLASNATCFSFHAVKNLATGDGGMVTTNDGELAEKLRRLRWCGIDKTTWDRTIQGQRYGWEYEVAELGFKCHMNDIQAAIGLVQLGKLEAANARRREIAGFYGDVLENERWIEIPVEYPYTRSAWHNYVIKTDDRDALHVYLKERGIATGVHYKPIHLQPFYYDEDVSLPVAESVWKRLLTLPLYPDLDILNVVYITNQIKRFGRENDV